MQTWRANLEPRTAKDVIIDLISVGSWDVILAHLHDIRIFHSFWRFGWRKKILGYLWYFIFNNQGKKKRSEVNEFILDQPRVKNVFYSALKTELRVIQRVAHYVQGRAPRDEGKLIKGIANGLEGEWGTTCFLQSHLSSEGWCADCWDSSPRSQWFYPKQVKSKTIF